MQEGKEKGMYHQFCYDPDAIYEQVSTISGMEGKFKIASNTLLTDELLALYAQAYTILKPYFLESKKASFESTEGPKILEAYMQQHSSSEKTAIESPKSLFSSKILDGNYVFSSCPAEAKIIKYENNTLTYTLGGKEFTMTDESQLRKGILYKKDLVANLFANGVDARHRVQVEENLSVELLHMPSVDAFFLWLEDNIEGKNGYRLSRTQCKIIFDTLNTYEAEKKLFAYPEAEKTFQEVQDTKVKERFEKGITKQETRELLTAYPYLEMYVPYL
ncbi:MAG: hypothetical protein Q8O99_05845 [bacterium]|nr:hypothetical protein [bacterium]